MNIKTKLVDDHVEKPQTFEGSFVSEELVREPKRGDNYINKTRTAGNNEFSVLKENPAAEYDVCAELMKHDSFSCATCNTYTTKRVTSHKRAISRKPEAAHDFLVERVIISEHEFHDLCCFSCNSYINKSLPRRDISPDEETIGAEPEQVIVPMPVIERDTLSPERSDQLDMIKAVVYGGLLQSITSLSVVFSAAGGDISTLNIVALGLANVFGGLLVLAHNLRALKQEQNRQRYEQELGRPGHFLFHATITIISYLVFGGMSPIVYGFSFYRSNSKYLKLATLAVVSLVCIMLLSMGKAYVQRPPKAYLKTILSYISLGVMAAGPGYIAGDLANMLLKKLEMFNSSSPDSTNLIEAEVVKRAWSSY